MNPLALLLGVKPTSGNTSQIQIASADNSEGNGAFGDALLLALDTSHENAGAQGYPQQASDTEEQAQGVEVAIVVAANPAAAFPLVNQLAQVTPGEHSTTDADILPGVQVVSGQDTSQAAANQPQILAPTLTETPAEPVLQPTTQANPAIHLFPEAVQPALGAPVQAIGEQTSAEPAVQILTEQPPAEPLIPADTQIDIDPMHATRQAVSVSPDTTPAPHQETPPAGSGMRETEAAQSARISTNEPVTPSQAAVTAEFERVEEGSQPETLQRMPVEAETPEIAAEPRMQVRSEVFSRTVEENPVESIPVDNSEPPADPSLSEDRPQAQATVQNQDAPAQVELPEMPLAAGEAARINPPRESTEPLRSRRTDTTEPQPLLNEADGSTGDSAEVLVASQAQTNDDASSRNPFQNPEAAAVRARAIEQSVFTAVEEIMPEPFSVVQQEVSPPTAPLFSGSVAEVKNAALATEAASLHAPDQARMVDQVVKAIDLSQRQGTTDLTVRLDPPELGTLHIKVSMTAGQLTAEVRAADHRIHQMIAANQAEIHEALRQAGVRLEQITVPSYTSASGGFSHQEHHANWDNTGSRPGGFTSHFSSEGGSQDDQSRLRHSPGSRSVLLDTLA